MTIVAALVRGSDAAADAIMWLPLVNANRWVDKMRLSDVRRLLDGDLSVVELRAQNAAALVEYAARGAEVGSVMRVPVAEDRDLTISRADVVCACELFRTGALRVEELAFIADVLQLSERVDFEDSAVADHIAEFTDPKVNGPFTQERAAFIIKALSRST